MLVLDIVMIEAEFMKSKTCCQREEEKIKRKVKLYAEVEFSAQGYDTHLTRPTRRHRPKVFAV